jgi:hypothetical protein
MGMERGERGRGMIYHPPSYVLSNTSRSTELLFITDIAGRAAETKPGRWKKPNRTLSISASKARFSQGRDHPPMSPKTVRAGGRRGKQTTSGCRGTDEFRVTAL